MGLCNSSDIFQENMNELFNGLDIDDLLIMSNKSFVDHIKQIRQSTKQTKPKRLRRKVFFRHK